MQDSNNPLSDFENKQVITFSLNDLPTNSTLTTNVKQECIVTTYDKVKLVLMEYENDKRHSSNWYAYLGMAISFLVPALTAEFKDIWIIEASFVHAAFWLVSIGFLAATVFAIFKRIRKRKKIKIDYCLQRIRNETVQLPK